MPDTPEARRDLAAQYRTISRLDQGVGLVLSALDAAGVTNDTLIIFTSDNGSPFPSGRTNVYEPGLRVPLLIKTPTAIASSTQTQSNWPATLLDIAPTVLDWFGMPLFTYQLNGHDVRLTGTSLLPVVTRTADNNNKRMTQFASHTLHEATMAYAMRAAHDATTGLKLIHNINYLTAFPIDQDFYMSPTFQDILRRTRDALPLNWTKTLKSYYFRPEFECFNLTNDPNELDNVFDTTTSGGHCRALMDDLRQ